MSSIASFWAGSEVCSGRGEGKRGKMCQAMSTKKREAMATLPVSALPQYQTCARETGKEMQ